MVMQAHDILSLRTWLGHAAFFAAVAVSVLMLSGCAAASKDPAARDARYVYCILKTGPQSASKTREEREKIFEGHMANMHRLADEGTLLIAGPYSEPHDRTLRGIFLFNVATVAEAQALVATDPGVSGGVFAPSLFAAEGSPVLRDMPEIERAFLKSQGTPAPKPGEPPPNIRAYVMLSGPDHDAVQALLLGSSLRGTIVWSIRLADTGGGVFIIDAEKPDMVRAALPSAAAAGLTIDGWWSTKSLERLPRQ